MSETQGLLDRIAALRREPDYPSSLPPGRPAAAGAPAGDRLATLQKQVASGYHHDAAVERLLRQTGSPARAAPDSSPLPVQITARLRRLLDRGRALVEDLRRLAGEPLLQHEEHPLSRHYAETAAMADVALRLLQTFPEAPHAQLHLCGGLEGILRTVEERVARLLGAVAHRRREQEAVHALAEMLTRLHEEQPVELDSFTILAETIVTEAKAGTPLRFLDPEGETVAAWAAAHSITTARVAARLAVRHPDLRGRATDAALAALLHDVGMLAVPFATLTQAAPLNGEQRRQIELHTLHDQEVVRQWLPGAPEWLAEAVATHHERLDGTGYPAGLRHAQIPLLGRFLAVCDVYAALVCSRPHRPALDPRQALTETLTLAKHGLLDGAQAAELLELSFYPVGTAVELADGSLGVVVGVHSGRPDVSSPARPVVVLLSDAAGRPLHGPHVLDLKQVEGRAVVRSLSAEERQERLGSCSADWAS